MDGNVTVYGGNIKLQAGRVDFLGYEQLLDEAMQVAEMVSTMEVTEDSVKEVKKVLANVNKSLKALNDGRIAVKKEILKPYDAFQEQVREIESVVSAADSIVRSQVREFEEKEREVKKGELREIWDLRIEAYEYAKVMDFEDWLTPQMLNKSTPMKKAEEYMTSWLERVEREVETLSQMPNPDELIQIYKTNRDLAITLGIAKQKEEEKERIREVTQGLPKVKERFIFIIEDEQQANFAKLLLENNKIKFEMKKG